MRCGCTRRISVTPNNNIIVPVQKFQQRIGNISITILIDTGGGGGEGGNMMKYEYKDKDTTLGGQEEEYYE